MPVEGEAESHSALCGLPQSPVGYPPAEQTCCGRADLSHPSTQEGLPLGILGAGMETLWLLPWGLPLPQWLPLMPACLL